MNLLPINSKVFKDRRINRLLDGRLALFGRFILVGVVSIHLLNITSQTIANELQWISMVASALTVAAAIGCLVVCLQFHSIYARGARRWRRIFLMGFFFTISLNALAIGQSNLIHTSSLGLTLVLFLHAMSSFASIAFLSSLFSCYLIYNGIILILGPVAIVLFQGISPLSSQVLGFSLLSYSVLACFGFIQAKGFWRQQEEKFLTEQKVYALSAEQLTSKTQSTFDVNQFMNITRGLAYGVNDMIAGVTLLEEEKDKNRQNEIHKLVKRSALSQLRKLDSIEDYVKLQGNKLPIEDGTVNMLVDLEALFLTVGSFARLRNIHFNYFIATDFPNRIKCDAQRVIQALENLLNYSIEICKTGQSFVEVSFLARVNQSDLMQVIVSDVEKPNVDVDLSSVKHSDRYKPDLLSPDEHRTGGGGLTDSSGLLIGEALIQHLGGELNREIQPTSVTTVNIPVTEASTHRGELDLLDTFSKSHVEVFNAPLSLKPYLLNQFDDWGLNAICVDEIVMKETADVVETETAATSAVTKTIALIFMEEETDALKIQGHRDLSDYDDVIYVVSDLNKILHADSEHGSNHDNDWEGVYKLNAPLSTRRLKELLYSIHQVKKTPRKVNSQFLDKEKAVSNCGRILLVEDQKVNQMVAAGMLKKLGYQPSLAQDGEEALLLLEKNEYDLILMDCQMAGMDGFAATEAIRIREKQGNKSRHIPIIALTAHSGAEDQTRCMAVGMDECLTKPVKYNQLEGSLRRWLGRNEKTH